MKLKRNIFAFLIMVFILSGCVSDVSLGTIENTNLTNTLTQVDVQSMQTNQQIKNTAYQNFVKDSAYTKMDDKVIGKAAFAGAFSKLAQLSDVDQYEPPKPEPVVEEVAEEEDTSVFYPRTTLYGVDCYGCSMRGDGTGNTATGVLLNPSIGVMQSNGTWLPGLTYDGYYIIAADCSIPFYSIIEISNHGLSGMGFSPDVPIRAIVLDRGGGISGAHIDLYIGSEANIYQINRAKTQPVARIIRYGR